MPVPEPTTNKPKDIAIVGAGWYGCHTAIELAKQGCNVTIYEKGPEIFGGISKQFGVRLHAGPHYPRSQQTREDCRRGAAEFKKVYPELVIENKYSLYGYAEIDAEGNPAKVSVETFDAVCQESTSAQRKDPTSLGYNAELLKSLWNVSDEATIAGGAPLKEFFIQKLAEVGVSIVYNCNVDKIIPLNSGADGVNVVVDRVATHFDFAVNATSYQDLLLPSNTQLPHNLNIVYQPCLAWILEDLYSPIGEQQSSFIVMEGWYPTKMGYTGRSTKGSGHYNLVMLTHGSFTIMGSYLTAEEAQLVLNELLKADVLAPTDEYNASNRESGIERAESSDEEGANAQEFTNHRERQDAGSIREAEIKVKERGEIEISDALLRAKELTVAEISKFQPDFNNQYRFVGVEGAVLAKLRTQTEFRDAVTFMHQKIMYVIPGKVSNIFDMAREISTLIEANTQNIITQGDCQYVQGGALDRGEQEITAPLDNSIKNTCELQTLVNLQSQLEAEAKEILTGDKENYYKARASFWRQPPLKAINTRSESPSTRSPFSPIAASRANSK